MKITRDQMKSLKEQLPKARVIDSASGPKGTAAILADHFALLGSVGWDLIGWQEIQTGFWDAKKGIMSWELINGVRGAIQLDDPGDLPLVFAERVRASIVTERSVKLPDGRGSFTIAARRAPSGGSLTWTVYGIGEDALADEEIRNFVTEQAKAIEQEYS